MPSPVSALWKHRVFGHELPLLPLVLGLNQLILEECQAIYRRIASLHAPILSSFLDNQGIYRRLLPRWFGRASLGLRLAKEKPQEDHTLRLVPLTLGERQTVGVATSGLLAWMHEFISEVNSLEKI